ncbi:Uncharacterised protein [Chlamydia trachomatis]|nr:Uncharacterised protein [Chlamydia trachomatis]CRH49022.1 Uncharacterised protein [Chlamydia trachomatis]
MESATIEENNGLFSYFQTLLDAPNDRLREERLFPSFFHLQVHVDKKDFSRSRRRSSF